MFRINIFEGSRRVALLLKIIYVIAVIVIAYMDKPYVNLHFATSFPNVPLGPSADDCKIGTDGVEFTSRDMGPGTVSVELCFKAQNFKDRMLIPYRLAADGTLWGNTPYSDEVSAYMKTRVAEFKISDADKQAATQEWYSKRRTSAWYAFLSVVGGWVTLSVLQTIVGWIVRGFTGIPFGHDRWPDPPTQEQ